jgi:hypothetical protein
MSEVDAALTRVSHRNHLESWRGSRLARTVHSPLAVLAMTLTGCVIPPSLSVSEDAAVNSPPAILQVTSEQSVLPEPGPVVFEQQSKDTLSITVIDTDITDTLYVGIYVDYNMPNRLAARSNCMAPPGLNPTRTTTCRLNSLCIDTDVGVQRVMSIMVFDRRPDESGGGNPPFQGMEPGGLSTGRFYFLKCQPAQSP